MKIENSRGVGAAGGPRKAGAAAAPGFAPSVDGPAKSTAATGVAAVTPLDAILALQSEEPPGQRRRRQTSRGRAALDVLERLERALVLGHAPSSLRAELDQVQRGAEATGEADLDEVLREIDIRVAVEAAKLDRLLGRA
ncbi:MAG TPA: flagellar assembly protein FliX [Vitreimonas sp.]|uniref:flagellar assembly protein FliX n=1 Tax=Vitreimonas sp. TaxID=3069702 RepID=UPI002D43C91E|nr:flagellar assembly protein FliX [Vitreimonas sp.]HYD88269.1 flagellar assembly protein FliX [Vitreimonas sp.]